MIAKRTLSFVALLFAIGCASGGNGRGRDTSSPNDEAFDRVQLTQPAFDMRKTARYPFILMADQTTSDYTIVTAGEDTGTYVRSLGRFKVMRDGPVLYEDPRTDQWVEAPPAEVKEEPPHRDLEIRRPPLGR